MNKPNIILISIDTLRADHLYCYGYHRHTTPNIDALAAEGTIYRQNYSTGVWTPPGHASMLTGLYVSEHGVYGERKLSANIPTIAKVLKENGYQTSGFVNNSQVGEMVGLHKGHDSFTEVWKGVKPRSITKRAMKGIMRRIRKNLGYEDMGAKRTNKLFKNWINNDLDKSRPFYTFLHYIEVHNPLDPCRPFKNKFLDKRKTENINWNNVKKVAFNPLICYVENLELNDEEIAIIRDLYDGEIAYIDHKVGEVVAFLKKNKLYDNTMILITSDHGEHLGEHGLWSHVASLHKEVLHVPLIIKYPKGVKYISEVKEYTQLVDIFPTIMEIAEVSRNELRPSSSYSLVYNGKDKLKYHEYIFAEWEGRVPYFIQDRINNSGKSGNLQKIKLKMAMIQDRQYKYIYKSDGSDQIYDVSHGKETMQKVVDEIKEGLRSELFKKSTFVKFIEEDVTTVIDNIDKEITENLKFLGYM